MINFPLYQTMLKRNLLPLAAYSAAIVGYVWLLTWIFPTIAGNEDIKKILNTMPEPMLKMFDINQFEFINFNNYMATEFFSLVWIILMSVYTVTTAVNLVAKMVDNKSIGSILASPLSRLKIVVTQFLVLLSGLLIITAVTILAVVIGSAIWDIEIEPERYIRLGLMGLLFFTAVGSYCLLFSTLFNEAKTASTWAGGLTFIFYILSLAGKLTEETRWLKNITIFSLFNPLEILEDSAVITDAVVLAAIAVPVTAAAVKIFLNRDFSV